MDINVYHHFPSELPGELKASGDPVLTTLRSMVGTSLGEESLLMDRVVAEIQKTNELNSRMLELLNAVSSALSVIAMTSHPLPEASVPPAQPVPPAPAVAAG